MRGKAGVNDVLVATTGFGGERAFVRDAELVAPQAGGYIGMRAGVDIGVHAQRYRRPLAEGASHCIEPLELRLALDVETEDALSDSKRHLLARLADAGKHHLARVAARAQRLPDHRVGDGVEADLRPVGRGDERPDDYAWMRDRDDPAVVAHLEAENAFCAQWFEPHDTLREAIFGEIKSRVRETDESVPVRKGSWWYVGRTEEGKSYGIHCRGRSAEAATTDVLLDENADAAAIKAQYKVLVKRFHPDANGGDRSTEDKLREIIQAYNHLRSAKLA